MRDQRGNYVTYNWWCDPSKDCYLDTISYNGTVVKFYYETRPDPITYANGSYLAQVNYRLKTIDVKVSGSRARAYTLTGLANYAWYTVTLNAMLDNTPFLTDTIRTMPTDILVYLPLVMKGS